MTLRFAPPSATWLLRQFYSGSDYDSIVGDLTEQYQFGHSSIWYWKQVIAIIFLGTYRHLVQRPLVSTSRPPIGQAFALIVMLVFLIGALLSELWFIFLVPAIIGALFTAGVIASRGRDYAPPKPSVPYGIARKEIPMRPHRGINTASVAGEGFEGLPGLIMAIAFVFLFVSIFLPRDADWMLGVFIAVEVGAAVLYIRAARRDKEAAEQTFKALHEINEDQDPRTSR